MIFQMFKLGLQKAEEPEIKLPTSVGYRRRKKIPEKHLLLLQPTGLFLLCPIPYLCAPELLLAPSIAWEKQEQTYFVVFGIETT